MPVIDPKSVDFSKATVNRVVGVAVKPTKTELWEVWDHASQSILLFERHNASDWARMVPENRILGRHVEKIEVTAEEVVPGTLEPVAEVIPETPPTDAENALAAFNKLRAEAKELGIKVDPTWGQRRLHEEIEKALAE